MSLRAWLRTCCSPRRYILLKGVPDVSTLILLVKHAIRAAVFFSAVKRRPHLAGHVVFNTADQGAHWHCIGCLGRWTWGGEGAHRLLVFGQERLDRINVDAKGKPSACSWAR